MYAIRAQKIQPSQKISARVVPCKASIKDRCEKYLNVVSPVVIGTAVSILSAAPALAEECGEVELLNFGPTLPVVWLQLLGFVYFLDKYVMRPGLAVMDERDAMVRAKIAEAERLQREAEEAVVKQKELEELKAREERAREIEMAEAQKQKEAAELQKEKEDKDRKLRATRKEMGELYQACLEKLDPLADQLAAQWSQTLAPFKDINKCIDMIPESLPESIIVPERTFLSEMDKNAPNDQTPKLLRDQKDPELIAEVNLVKDAAQLKEYEASVAAEEAEKAAAAAA